MATASGMPPLLARGNVGDEYKDETARRGGGLTMPDTIYTAPNVAYISTEALDRGTLDFLKAIDIWKGRCFASERENQRLRAALESLTSDPPSTLDEPDEDWQVIVKMRAVAHAALAHTNGTREGEA